MWKRHSAMMRYILKVFTLLLFCSVAVAQEVQDLKTSSYVDTIGSEKKLSFVHWGSYPEKELEQAFLSFSKAHLSPVTRDILIQVLSEKTSFDAEVGKEGAWLDLRLQMLKNLRAHEALTKIVPFLPAEQGDKIKIEAFFLAKDWYNGCTLVEKYPEEQEEKLFCAALIGSKEEAELLYELALEKNELSPTSLALIKGLLEKSPKPKDFPEGSLSTIQRFAAETLKWTSPIEEQKAPHYAPFGRAIHLKKVQALWEKEPLEHQNYRWVVLMTYVSLFRPDIQFVGNKNLTGKVNPLSLKLKDRPESKITGKDVLTALLFLDGQTINLYEAFLLLQKSGVDIEQWALEQINP